MNDSRLATLLPILLLALACSSPADSSSDGAKDGTGGSAGADTQQTAGKGGASGGGVNSGGNAAGGANVGGNAAGGAAPTCHVNERPVCTCRCGTESETLKGLSSCNKFEGILCRKDPKAEYRECKKVDSYCPRDTSHCSGNTMEVYLCMCGNRRRTIAVDGAKSELEQMKCDKEGHLFSDCIYLTVACPPGILSSPFES